ncbi:hypothetical protein NMG60_11018993 [Bertholletia excelsa]
MSKVGLLDGSFKDFDHGGSRRSRLLFIRDEIAESWSGLQVYGRKLLEMGRSDPRKVIFAVKMGLALAIISLLLFWEERQFFDLTQYSIWAILTVVVMFEFSIGATLIKGFNRGLGTLFAGAIAFGFANLAMLAGRWEKIVIIISIFITGACAAYLKLYPTMTPYEYGFRVFVLTYCILMVAGNRSREYTEAIVNRLVLIAVGAGVCFIVNTCIYPIWAGDDLHRLVVMNFRDVATSLEGCVKEYIDCLEYKRCSSKILTYQAYDDPLYTRYRSVVESASREQNLLGFAIWEPPHGRYRMFNYPWRNYVKVSGALRHCVFMVMALHGCVLSEIQAPTEHRQIFRSELQKVGSEGARVLRKLGDKVEKMERLVTHRDLLKEVHKAAEQLQKKIDKKSYLLVNAASWEIGPKEPEGSEKLRNRDDKDEAGQNHPSPSEKLQGPSHLSATVLESTSFPLGPQHELAKSASERVLREREASWPFRRLPSAADCSGAERAGESATALSLATFVSLLMEFVARLQNVVDAFVELSEKAAFKEPETEFAGVGEDGA